MYLSPTLIIGLAHATMDEKLRRAPHHLMPKAGESRPSRRRPWRVTGWNRHPVPAV
jgi:hypothetical protein